MIDFGKRLKTLRVQAGFTQEQLAERTDVSKSIISCYERYQCYPSLEHLVKLSEMFHVSTDYLLGLENNTIDVSGLDEADIELVRQVVDYFRKKNQT